MSRRIYWLLPDANSARRTMNDLLLARISESHIHFVAPEGADTSGLHMANVLQTSDLLRSAQLGLVVGGATGAVAGALAAVFFPIAGASGLESLQAALALPQWSLRDLLGGMDAAQWAMASVLALAGGVLGAWSSSLIGVSTPSHRLQRFEGAIAQGQFLLMVDVPASRVEEIEVTLGKTHPEAHLEGLEPNVPAFP